MVRSLQEFDTLMSTIRRVDKEISRRRLEIKRNIVPNAGLARQQVEALVRENNRRKAYLRVNAGHIEALRASGARFTPLRTSFITPDGPKNKGSKRDSRRMRRRRDNVRKTIIPKSKPITKKQGKKAQGPMIPISAPMPVKETVAKPRQVMQQAADSIREQNAILAKQREQVIRKQQDAQRDAELVKQGQAQVVAQRRAREAAEAKAKAEAEAKRRRAQVAAAAKQAAAAAEQKARAAASKVSQKKVSQQIISRGRGFFDRRSGPIQTPFRRTGFLPQMVMMTALNDKKRSQTVNNAVRTPSSAPQAVISDQITEDIRRPVSSPNQRSPEFMAFMKQFSSMTQMAHKEINLARQGRGQFGDMSRILGKNKTDYFANKALGLLKQVKQMVSNEAIRWDQGALNAGVSVSTDNRSQSKRKMSIDEFGNYIEAKIKPMGEAFMRELMEEVMRAEQARQAQKAPARKVALDNSLAVSRQRTLAASDKLRGHGRPVLSEQQGTKGLAGLFPALRSSMQGVLHR